MSWFFNLERRLQAEPAVYAEYRSFMHDYQLLGHMKISTTPGKYVIPEQYFNTPSIILKYFKDKI